MVAAMVVGGAFVLSVFVPSVYGWGGSRVVPARVDADADSSGQAALVVDPPWPSSVANRKVLDQYGDVYLIRTFSSWAMASNLSNAAITTALEGVAANGFNGVTVWIGGGANYGADWSPRYQHQVTGQSFWTGTPWASPLGGAWASLDHLVTEARRLGLFVWMSLNGGFGSFGARADWERVANTDMHDAGVAVASRYRSAPNVGWHVMFDDNIATTAPAGQRIEAFFDGVNDTEGASTRPVRWLEVANGSSTNEQGWLKTANFHATINSWYEYGSNSAEIAESGYAEVASVPVGDSEPPYDGAPHYVGNAGQQLRERSYATFLEGGSLINYGHEDWWRFGLTGLYSDGLTWPQVQSDADSVQQAHAWDLLDDYVADPTWSPTGTFLTTGTGSGDTKAAAGRSETAAIAYFPTARPITIDTSALPGTKPVRLRWYDPTTGSYTTIITSESQEANRSVPYPSAHPDGSNDWILVVELAVPEVTATTTTTLPPTTSTLPAATTTTVQSATTIPPTTTTTTTTTPETTSTLPAATTTTVQPTIPATTIPPTTTTTTTTTIPPTTTTTTPPTTTVPPAITVPTAPRALAANAGHQAVKLTWLAQASDGGAPITDYVVQRSADGGRTWATVADGLSTARSAIVGGLTNGHRYRFRVAAVNEVGRGPLSATASAVPATVPTAPRALSVTRAYRAAKLTWQAPASNGGAAITDYVVQRSANGGRTWGTVRDGVRVRPTATVSGLAPGKRHNFRVSALNRAGRGAWSAIVSLRLK